MHLKVEARLLSPKEDEHGGYILNQSLQPQFIRDRHSRPNENVLKGYIFNNKNSFK